MMITADVPKPKVIRNIDRNMGIKGDETHDKGNRR